MEKENTQSRSGHSDLRIGVMVDVREKGPVVSIDDIETHVRFLLQHGLETVDVTYWQNCGDMDLDAMADRLLPILQEGGATLSALSLFCNPLMDTDAGQRSRKDWQRLIELAGRIGCPLVTGFTGALTGRPLPDSVPVLKEVFQPMLERAGELGLKLAFENCQMGTTWDKGGSNMMHNPDGWELVFDALPYENLGMVWEPGHLVVQLSNPIENLREWGPKVIHVHGKDGHICHDLLNRYGIHSKRRYKWQTMPGFGDTDWNEVISELRRHGYRGALVIEGYHDPIYRDDLEMTGQVAAIRYLKECRGGEFIANPEYSG